MSMILSYQIFSDLEILESTACLLGTIDSVRDKLTLALTFSTLLAVLCLSFAKNLLIQLKRVILV